MTKSEHKFVIVPPGEEHLWDGAEDCPIPLSELTPPEPMSPADLLALKAQLQEMGSHE